MSKRLILTLIAISLLAAAACANPAASDERTVRARAAHDQSATPGGNMMGSGG